MLFIKTRHLGDIEVPEDKIITLPAGLLGFEGLRRYVLITVSQESPFCWFQCLDEGNLSFVVVNPCVINKHYEPMIDDTDLRMLEIADISDVVLMAVVTIREKPFLMSANLRAPIVINKKKLLAKQIILTDQSWPIQYDLLENKEDVSRERDHYDAQKNAISYFPTV